MSDNKPMNLNCPSCGAPLDYDGTSSVVRCKFCKNIAFIPGLTSARESNPHASLDEIRNLVQDGNLLEAIRRYREIYGTGLKEAKDAVDALAGGKVVIVQSVFSSPPGAEETSRVLEEVKELLRSGNKIGAIKRYREVNDVSLSKAKDVVDQVEAALTGIPVPPHHEIVGHPSPAYQPDSAGRWLGCGIVIAILIIVGGVLAFAFSRQGNSNLFGSPLYASGQATLISSRSGTLPDVASVFYNSDSDARLVGLVDGTTGKLLWQAEPLVGDGYADAIVDGGELVYVANGSDLLAYRKTDGSLAWQTHMPDKLNYGEPSMLSTIGRVITLNVDQSLQAYDSANGSLVWSRRLAGYDRTLRIMGGSLVVLDYSSDSYAYSLFILDPLDGSEQRLLTPTCHSDQYSSATLDADSELLFSQSENALFLVYDAFIGCVQRIDFATGQTTWQTISKDSFSFSPYGFNTLVANGIIYFNNGSQILAVDKQTGTIKTLLTNEDYDLIPLAISGDTLLVRARRTRGSERFEFWGIDAATGNPLWQLDLQEAAPIDPPNKMAGLVDETDTGFTWKLLPAGLVLIKFQGNPNQMVLDTIDPVSGNLLGERTIALVHVTGDFYSVPSVIGWNDQIAFLNVESKIYALDLTTGEFRFYY